MAQTKYASLNSLKRLINNILNKINFNIQTKVIITEEEIKENTNYTIPLTYQVGNNSLDIFYMGENLIKDVHYIEIGATGSKSNTIQFKDWGQPVPIGRTIKFVVKGG